MRYDKPSISSLGEANVLIQSGPLFSTKLHSSGDNQHDLCDDP